MRFFLALALSPNPVGYGEQSNGSVFRIESVLPFRLGKQLRKIGPSAHLQPLREWHAR